MRRRGQSWRSVLHPGCLPGSGCRMYIWHCARSLFCNPNVASDFREHAARLPARSVPCPRHTAGLPHTGHRQHHLGYRAGSCVCTVRPGIPATAVQRLDQFLASFSVRLQELCLGFQTYRISLRNAQDRTTATDPRNTGPQNTRWRAPPRAVSWAAGEHAGAVWKGPWLGMSKAPEQTRPPAV